MRPMKRFLLICTFIPVFLGSTMDNQQAERIHMPDNRLLVKIVLANLDLWSEAAEAIVLRTGVVESLYYYREALNFAPELGYWQIHPETAEDILFRYLQRSSKLDIREKLEKMLGYDLVCLEDDPTFFADELRNNDVLGIALCRIRYVMAPYRIPGAKNIAGQAWMWKHWFNTKKGKGSTRRFVKMVNLTAL